MPIAVKPVDRVKICIDRGGTFCDVIAMSDSKGDHLVKLLSMPHERVCAVSSNGSLAGETIPRDEPIDTSRIEYLRMGTTVATNGLLERKGESQTRGFKGALEVSTQSRPFLFQLAIRKPDVLYTKVVEVDERVTPGWPEFIV